LEPTRRSNPNNVKLTFDTIHALYRNEVPTDYVYRMGPDLRHVHLADTDRLPPGSGRGDFVSLVAALKEVGYAGYLAMEIGFNRRDVEPDWVARQAYDYMKPLLDH
jgi:protein FrlC